MDAIKYQIYDVLQGMESKVWCHINLVRRNLPGGGEKLGETLEEYCGVLGQYVEMINGEGSG